LRVDVRGLFGDGIDVRKSRAFLETHAKLCELLGRADGVGFDAAVAKIADVAAEAEIFRGALREEAEADTLHAAGDEEAGCFFCGVHKRRNCSEREEGCQVEARMDFVE
jgi:hypothetical protein